MALTQRVSKKYRLIKWTLRQEERVREILTYPTDSASVKLLVKGQEFQHREERETDEQVVERGGDTGESERERERGRGGRRLYTYHEKLNLFNFS